MRNEDLRKTLSYFSIKIPCMYFGNIRAVLIAEEKVAVGKKPREGWVSADRSWQVTVKVRKQQRSFSGKTRIRRWHWTARMWNPILVHGVSAASSARSKCTASRAGRPTLTPHGSRRPSLTHPGHIVAIQSQVTSYKGEAFRLSIYRSFLCTTVAFLGLRLFWKLPFSILIKHILAMRMVCDINGQAATWKVNCTGYIISEAGSFFQNFGVKVKVQFRLVKSRKK